MLIKLEDGTQVLIFEALARRIGVIIGIGTFREDLAEDG